MRLRGLIESTKDRMLIFVAGESVFAVRKLIAKLGGTPAGRPPDDDEVNRRGLPPLISSSSFEFRRVSRSYLCTSRSIDISSAASGSTILSSFSFFVPSVSPPFSAGNVAQAEVERAARLAICHVVVVPGLL